MKIRKWEMIVFACLFALAITFSLLQKTWSGFSYFSSAIFLIFIGFFINNRIYYLRVLKKQYDEALQPYFVELYNNGMISRQQLENMDPRIVAGYYKDYKRYKILTGILIVIFAVIIISLILMLFKIW